jgi:hypothetical protein
VPRIFFEAPVNGHCHEASNDEKGKQRWAATWLQGDIFFAPWILMILSCKWEIVNFEDLIF